MHETSILKSDKQHSKSLGNMQFINTYAQKSSTVSKFVIILRFSVHDLDLSFLKNHMDHLFWSGCLMSSSGSKTSISPFGSATDSCQNKYFRIWENNHLIKDLESIIKIVRYI